MRKHTRKAAHSVKSRTSGALEAAAVPAASVGQRPDVAPKMKVWIVFGEHVKFGHGRAQLLQAIDQTGSLRQAAAQLGMSYRSVWGYLQALEAAVGVPLLERRVGGRGRGGTTLTPAGRAFLAQYLAFRQHMDTVLDQEFAAYFSRQG